MLVIRFAPALDRFVRNDAPLIAERAATCGRVATEGGDEHTVVRRALSVRDPALWQSAEAHCPSGLDERFVSHWAASVAARMRKAMSAPVIESRKASASTQMLTYWMFVINARIPPKTTFRDRVFLPSFDPG